MRQFENSLSGTRIRFQLWTKKIMRLLRLRWVESSSFFIGLIAFSSLNSQRRRNGTEAKEKCETINERQQQESITPLAFILLFISCIFLSFSFARLRNNIPFPFPCATDLWVILVWMETAENESALTRREAENCEEFTCKSWWDYIRIHNSLFTIHIKGKVIKVNCVESVTFSTASLLAENHNEWKFKCSEQKAIFSTENYSSVIELSQFLAPPTDTTANWLGKPKIASKGNVGGVETYGSGVCMGEFPWRTYCVLWNMRKARDARKSRDVNKPAAGRKVKPVFLRKKSFISCNCGSRFSTKIFSCSSLAKTTLYSRQACFGIKPLTIRNTDAQVLFSVSV